MKSIVLFYFVFSSLYIHAPIPPEKRKRFLYFYKIARELDAIIKSKKSYLKKLWKHGEYQRKTAIELYKISYKYKIPSLLLFALIELESGYNYRVTNTHNIDGSYDYGLTQQNSYYFQARCFVRYSRPCRIYELYNPIKSIQLMSVLLGYCASYLPGSKKRFILCYNSPYKAFKSTHPQNAHLLKTNKYLRIFEISRKRIIKALAPR